MQRLFRIVYLPLSGGMSESKENVTVCWSSRGPPYGEMELGLGFRKRGWEMSAGGLMTVRKACTVLGAYRRW